MALKRRLTLKARVNNEGDRVDSFATRAFLDNVVITKAKEELEERDNNTSRNLKNHFTNVVDVLGFAFKKADLSQRSKMRIIHNSCWIQGEVVAFQPNDGNTLQGRTNNAGAGDEEYMNTIVTGDL